MASYIIRPIADEKNLSSATGVFGEPGAKPIASNNMYTFVNEATADDDLSYIRFAAQDNEVVFEFEKLNNIKNISMVSVFIRYTRQPGVHFISGDEKTQLSGAGTDYATVSVLREINPGTGQAWTLNEINSLQVGIYLSTTKTDCKVTQVYVEVIAEPDEGGETPTPTTAQANISGEIKTLTKIQTNIDDNIRNIVKVQVNIEGNIKTIWTNS